MEAKDTAELRERAERATSPLEVMGINENLSLGYPGEPFVVDPAFEEWQTIPLSNSAGVNSYFTYRDSNESFPVGTQNCTWCNEHSSETKITLNTSWNATVDDSNVITLTTITKLVNVNKYTPAGSNGLRNSAGRTIYVYRPGNCGGVAKWTSGLIPVSLLGNIGGSPTLPIEIYRNTYKLYPQQGGGDSSAIELRNVYQGAPVNPCSNGNVFVDAIKMGFQFKNNLPNDLPTPILSSVNQIPDICENYVDVELNFEAINVGGALLYVEYRFGSENWSSDQSNAVAVVRNQPTTVTLYQLPPTNHTASPVTVYWRAKYKPNGSTLLEGDWLYGETQIMYVPAPNMTVPDITTPECSDLARGELVPPFEHEVCYTEYSCADQPPSQYNQINEEALNECRVINGYPVKEVK